MARREAPYQDFSLAAVMMPFLQKFFTLRRVALAMTCITLLNIMALAMIVLAVRSQRLEPYILVARPNGDLSLMTPTLIGVGQPVMTTSLLLQEQFIRQTMMALYQVSLSAKQNTEIWCDCAMKPGENSQMADQNLSCAQNPDTTHCQLCCSTSSTLFDVLRTHVLPSAQQLYKARQPQSIEILSVVPLVDLSQSKKNPMSLWKVKVRLDSIRQNSTKTLYLTLRRNVGLYAFPSFYIDTLTEIPEATP